MKALTTKQRQLLKVICVGNLDASGARVSDVDVYQLMSRLPYTASRESVMCSLAILLKQGWTVHGGKELRDGRMRQTFAPTAQATRVVTPPVVSTPVYQELEDDDVVVMELL